MNPLQKNKMWTLTVRIIMKMEGINSKIINRCKGIEISPTHNILIKVIIFQESRRVKVITPNIKVEVRA